MSFPLTLSHKAKQDVVLSAKWYAERRSGLDNEFLSEVGSCPRTIRDFPAIGSPLSKKLRLLPLKIFPYVITYQFTGKEVIVARIVHGRRHPRHRSSSEG